MVVKLIDDKDLWDKHIEESPYGTLFHRWDFLKIIEKHSGSTLYPYGVYRGEELVCLFPLFIKTFMNLQMVYSPPPDMAIPSLGFVMSSTYDKLKQRKKETYINGVADEMEEEIKKLRPNFIYISTVNGFVDVRPFRWNEYGILVNYSYAIDLTRPLDEIRESFDTGLKSKLSDAEKLPLSLCPTGDADLFYDIMAARFRQQGQAPPISSREYLKGVLAAYPDNVKLNILYEGDKAVDMAAYIQYKKQLALWIWSIGQPHGEYIAWDMIRKKKAEGMKSLEMPGASIKRNWDFISRFNAPLQYHYSITKNDLKGRIFSSMPGSRMKIRI